MTTLKDLPKWTPDGKGGRVPARCPDCGSPLETLLGVSMGHPTGKPPRWINARVIACTGCEYARI